MTSTKKLYRVNLFVDVRDSVTGEVYLTSNSTADYPDDRDIEEPLNRMLIDETVNHMLAELIDKWKEENVHPYVLRQSEEELRYLYESFKYDVSTYTKIEDANVIMCADVTLHAEI